MASDNERAEAQAHAQVDSIVDLMDALGRAVTEGQAEYNGETLSEDDLWQRLTEDPLSLVVRGNDWIQPGEEMKPTEYRILLCIGEPAVQIAGDLDESGQPSTADVQYQDWFTSWAPLTLLGHEQSAILEYSRTFFGDV